MKRTEKFNIGQQFKTRGKNPRVCTITDIHKTYDSDGLLVKFAYVATHEFMGQVVTSYDIPESAVAMGIIDTCKCPDCGLDSGTIGSDKACDECRAS